MATAVITPSQPRWQPAPPPPPEELNPYAEDPRPGLDFRLVLAVVMRLRWWIAGVIALALALAVLLTMLQTPRYTAAASVQINNQSDRVIGQGEDIGRADNSEYDADRFLKTQIQVLQSRGLAVRVAQALKLFGSERFYRAMGLDPAPTGLPPKAQRELTIGLLQANLKVDLPFDSRIAAINFTSGDPELSAQVANAFASEFIQSNLQRRYDSSAYARQFVGNQLADAKSRLEASERALNGYARAAGLIRTRDALNDGEKGNAGSGGGSVTTASLVQLNSAANDARAARIAAEGRWRAFNSVPLMGSKEVLANGTVQALMQQRASLETKLQEMRANHLDDYPAVAEVKAQVAEIGRQLDSAASNVRSSIRSEYTAAAAAEQALEAQVDSLKGATLSEQDRSVQYNLLAREADTNRSLYDGLLQRYKELNAAAGVATSNIAVIDQAESPMGPSSPNMRRNVLLGLILGLVLAAAMVALTVQFDDAIRVPEDVERKLALPLLGVVPRSDVDPEDALKDPKSPLSEGYNALRAALLHATSDGLPQVMLVTSAQPSEGKTTTSQAIATTLARLGKHVLLVDGDMRRPSVHRLTGGRNERGLSTLLTSVDPLESAVVRAEEPGLDLLTSGPLPISPTELTSSNRFRALIDEMADKYDAVIIDSPPILGLADAPSMSALVDGVVLVVESERSRRGGLKTAVRRLRAMHPILLGAVLTKFDTNRAGNRYSEYYGTHYYEYQSQPAAA